jgi:hypothetical protein
VSERGGVKKKDSKRARNGPVALSRRRVTRLKGEGKAKRGEREERRKKSFLEGAPRWVARTKERAIDVEFRISFLSFAPRSPAPGSAPDSGPHARWLGSSRLFTVFPRAGGSKALEGARGRRRRLHKGNIFSRRTCPLSLESVAANEERESAGRHEQQARNEDRARSFPGRSSALRVPPPRVSSFRAMSRSLAEETDARRGGSAPASKRQTERGIGFGGDDGGSLE